MSYLALYRKYRPQTFDDVIGQEAVVRTLKNAITNNMLAHAYVFSGPRGTGKTSMARILAKALNCREGLSVSPCLKCDLCSRITSGDALDVFEIDAASNRRIDDIRDLRDKIMFAPVEGRYKVYIIDEAHMLTDEAFNALLKTLEEPPAQTLFILATTDAHKIPVTILSRCQRIEFKRITIPHILTQLKKISAQENITIDDKALSLIAKSSEGGMRDSVSLLDQIVSFKGAVITADDVLTVLGSSDSTALFTMIEHVSTENAGQALAYLEELVISGKNIPQLTKDLLMHIRHVILSKAGAEAAIDLPADMIAQVHAQASRFTLPELKEIVRIISKADSDMRWYPNARLLLEIALVEICSLKKNVQNATTPRTVTATPQLPSAQSSASQNVRSVTIQKASVPAEPVPELRSSIATQPVVPPQPTSRPPVAEPVEIAAHPPEPVSPPPSVTHSSTQEIRSLAEIKHHWQDILNQIKERKKFTYLILCESEPVELSGGKLILRFKKNSTFHKEKFLDKEHQDIFQQILKQYISGPIEVTADVQGLMHGEIEGSGTTTHAANKGPQGGPPPASVERTLASMFDGKLMYGK